MNHKHHEFAPSSLERLYYCPGSYYRSKGLDTDQKPNEARDRGTFLHKCIQKLNLEG